MYRVADGPAQFNSVVFQIDETTGKCVGIERVDRIVELDGEVHSSLPAGSTTARTDSQAMSYSLFGKRTAND